MARQPAKGASTRLGADDWLRAGLDLLAEEGITGVKIQRLCDRLGVTKGSFYWHFQDLDAFLGALAARWSEEGIGATITGSDSEADLLAAMELFADNRNRDLTRAIRDWAQNDERARAAIRKADEALYEGLRDVMVGMGFDDAEAGVRAKILYYAGVGFAHVGPLGDRASDKDQIRATWEILTRR